MKTTTIYLWTTGEKTWWTTSEKSAVDWAEKIESRRIYIPENMHIAEDHTGTIRFYENEGDGSPLEIGCTRDDTPYLYGGKNFFARYKLEKADV